MRASVLRGLVVLVSLALAGCASLRSGRSDHASHADPAIRSCAQLFERVDVEVARANVRDGGEARIAGFPYLRANRFLASLRDRAQSAAALDEWLELMRKTDMRARAVEWRNFPAPSKDMEVIDRLEECGKRLTDLDARSDGRKTRLMEAVDVPDDYQTWKRILGAYALARIPFASGVRGYQRETERVFATPLEQLPVNGKLVRYGPKRSSDGDQERAGEFDLGALKVPRYAATDLARLLHRHAPIFEVDETGRFDRAGALHWNDAQRLAIDPAQPVVYQRSDFTRYGDRVLLQLQYVLWFPERPLAGTFDLLGGHLDGLVWRVTLDESGRPLIYDSIHPCGCYHQFFPTARAVLKPAPDTLEEHAFVPQQLGRIADGERIAIRVASRTHYIERVTVGGDAQPIDRPYALVPEDTLRSLPKGGGFANAFRPDGLVRGTQRAERLLFWPMGIASPGAMRQSGRQATAFIGRRHFDDARLVERYFKLEP